MARVAGDDHLPLAGGIMEQPLYYLTPLEQCRAYWNRRARERAAAAPRPPRSR